VAVPSTLKKSDTRESLANQRDALQKQLDALAKDDTAQKLKDAEQELTTLKAKQGNHEQAIAAKEEELVRLRKQKEEAEQKETVEDLKQQFKDDFGDNDGHIRIVITMDPGDQSDIEQFLGRFYPHVPAPFARLYAAIQSQSSEVV
jgi:recombination DNA repair RAD52 pathway protein